jgi:hypothetical protein
VTLLTTGTANTSDTADPDPLSVFDCANVPETVGAVTPLLAPRGYNDVVFTVDGGMVGWDGSSSLLVATDADTAGLYAPGIDMFYKMGLLPGGDIVLAMATADEVWRIEPSGNAYAIARGMDVYGLAVGSDGNVYVSTNFSGAAIARIDPNTQDFEVILELDNFPPRAIDFSRDFSALYFGTVDDGHVFKVPLDANLDPTGDPELLVTLPTTWHDTLEVDACGNIYVIGLFGLQMHRIKPDLSMTLLMEWTWDEYSHGFQWGDPTGGWDDHAIYMVHPDIGDRVDEVILGVPGRGWVGEVLGGETI